MMARALMPQALAEGQVRLSPKKHHYYKEAYNLSHL
jgi:hypothetical protein